MGHPGQQGLADLVRAEAGALGCGVAGALSDTLGKARVAGWSLVASAACATLTLVVYGRAPIWTFALVIVWGITVVADSAQFSASQTLALSSFAPGATPL